VAQNILLNGVVYSIPDVGDDNYGQDLTDYFVAIPSGVLQKSGGSFTLTAETNFGATYGLVAAYYKTRGTNLSSTGVFRLSNTEFIGWRNNANSTDLELGVNTSDQLTFNGNPILPSGGLTASRAVVTTATGLLTAATTTATEIGYVNGVTSAIQTQLDGKQAGPLTGDVTTSGAAATLASVNSNVGSFGSATTSGTFTVNAKGLITAASSTTIALNASAITGGTLATARGGTNANSSAQTGLALVTAGTWSWGTLSGDITSSALVTTLATVNANVGSFGSSTAIPSFTVNGKGLITAASTNAVIAPAGTLTGTTLASNVVTSSLTSVGTIATGVWQGTAIGATYGGTGGSSAASTGVPKVTAGVWSYPTLVAVADGGTGLASGTSGGLLYYSAAGTLASSGAYTAGRVLYGNGAGNAPTSSSAFSYAGSVLTVTGVGASSPGTAVIKIQDSAGLSATPYSGIEFNSASSGNTGRCSIMQKVRTGGSDAGMSLFTGGTVLTEALFISGQDQSATFNGNIAFTSTSTQGIVGTTTNDSAATGNVGQYTESVISTPASAPTSAQWGDLTSISLTAGDWDVTAIATCILNGGTATVRPQVGISTTSGNSATGLIDGSNWVWAPASPASTANASAAVPSYRMSLSGTTTVYLKVQFGYSAGTPQFQGRLSARRVR
jgi:hypothetical protein